MGTRARFLTLAVTTGLVGAVALPGTAAAAVPRDPGAPGCVLQGIGADHRAGTVVWQIACDERRWVTVDATAFSGTPDDHVVVDEQQSARWVEPGDTWVDVLTVETAGVDQIRAQAMTKTAPSDSTEPPAIIGGTTG
ncbi:hypothetical protein [Curtobacterium sp. VKM Ac-1393]|uniref:hypothetical protein n=1 Tax=Curtobacterium sp. VKM Ac-1393 TaxID=2783814 RepID=UPI00188D3057|nr:hypothetical protein [Curtobacterium sp. VKM Ac-1393]MBF4606108.1 hypothetical protein [Curtobacterium sp. VKM Ac-1393]